MTKSHEKFPFSFWEYFPEEVVIIMIMIITLTMFVIAIMIIYIT